MALRPNDGRPSLPPVDQGPDYGTQGPVPPKFSLFSFLAGWGTRAGRNGNRNYLPRPSVLDATTPLDQPREFSITVAQPGDPVPYVFGNCRVKPTIIAIVESGGYLYVDYLISQGEISSIDKVFIGGEEQTSLPSSWEYYTGASGQPTSGLMKNAIAASPLAYDALAGMAHVVAKLSTTQSFDVTFEVSGLKLFDPRTSPQAEAYSTNPALALRRILTDCGYSVNDTDVATCANYCEEQVSSKNRWTLNLQADTRRPLRDWVETIAAYGNIMLDIHGGTVRMIPDRKVTDSPQVTRTVTAANIVAGSAKTTKVGTRQVPEKVIVTYQELDGTQRTATAGSGSTGQITRLTMPGIQTYSEAMRYATEVLNKAQADLRHSHVTHDAGLADSVGDLHDIVYAPHGLSKRMRLVSYEEVERGRWRRDYVEYDDALYSDSDFVRPGVGDTPLQNPNTPPSGTDLPALTVTEELYVDRNALTHTRLKITWSGSTWPYTRDYIVTCDGEQNVLNAALPHLGSGTHTVYTAALKENVTYSTKIYIRSTTGSISATPNTASTLAQGTKLPPGDVSGLTGYEAGQFVALSWNAAVEIAGDLRGYQVRRLPAADYTATIADWTNTNSVTIAERHDGTSYLTPSQVPGSYYYMVRAIDSHGNLSENIAYAFVEVTADNAGALGVYDLRPQYGIDFVPGEAGQIGSVDFGNVLNRGTGDLTVEFEICLLDTPAENTRILAKDTSITTAGSAGWGVYLDTSAKLNAEISDGTTQATLTATNALALGQEYPVAVVFDRSGSPQELRLFIDGSEDATAATSIATVTGSTTNATSLYAAFPALHKARFRLSRIRMWSDVRTAAEISNNAGEPIATDAAGLIGYWPVEASNAGMSTLYDRSSSGNNGAISGGVRICAFGLANMELYRRSGTTTGEFCITSKRQTWGQRFTASPNTWDGSVTSSPQERWGGDLATDSEWLSDAWDNLTAKQGSWAFSTQNITLYGGTQSNILRLGSDDEPIVYTSHSGNTAQASGRYMRARTATTDSPATAGDGLLVKTPVVGSRVGAVLTQSGSETIAATSPLINPVTVTFAIAYSDNPRVSLTVSGATPKIAAVDNLSPTSFDLYLWNTSGNIVDGTVYWEAVGT